MIYLVLGCFMDQLAILVLTLPIVFAMILRFGYDPMWFGIVLTKTVEIGLITPPFGMNCFVASSISKMPLSQVFRGVTPFIGAEIVTIGLLEPETPKGFVFFQTTGAPLLPFEEDDILYES